MSRDELDLTDPALIDDPYPALAELRSAGKPVWHAGMGLWLAARHADASAVLRHRGLGRIFRERQPIESWSTFNWLHADSILDSEPPQHTRLKSLVSQAFARGHIERLRPTIVSLATSLLDVAEQRMRESGSFDLIADYAEPLPVLVIAELLGIPENHIAKLRPWSQAIVKMYEYERTPAQDRAAQQACVEFADCVSALAKERRSDPRDDLVSHLASVEDGGQRLSERELIATAVLLLNAGHEASVNGFGNGIVAALNHRDQWEQLARDPWGLTPTAIEEFLRYDSPLHLFERTAITELEINGVVLRPGDRIAALIGSANRDAAAFDDADSFNLSRDPNPHISFGAGIHFCLGAPLARLELGISLPLLVERMPHLRLAAPPKRRPSFVLRGYESIPATS